MEQTQPVKELSILRDAGWRNQDFADLLGLNYRTFCRRRGKGTLTEQHLYLLREVVGNRVLNPRNVDKTGVYYLRPEGSAYVKIGFTTDIGQRTTHIQVSSPEPLSLIAWFPSPDSSLEAIHHERWKAQHYRGEWFHYDPLMKNAPYPEEDNIVQSEDTPPDHDSLASLM